MKFIIAFACLLAVVFSSNVKSDDTEAAEQYFSGRHKQQTGYWNRNWNYGRRWARSAGAEETDVAQKDTNVAEQYYPYYYPAMNGLAINGLGVNGLGINGLGHGLRWARSITAEKTDASQKDTDVADSMGRSWDGRWIRRTCSQGRRWTRSPLYHC